MKLPVPYNRPKSFNYEKYPPLGIDLGTTNSAIARWVNTRGITGSQVYQLNEVSSPNFPRLLPSMVYHEEVDGEEYTIVGKIAVQKRIATPDLVAAAFKRYIGDPTKRYTLGSLAYSPVELSTEVVKTLLAQVRKQGLTKPAGLVVSVPYYFKQHQKSNTRLAVERALDIVFSELPEDERPHLLELIPEPVAAALSYAANHWHTVLNQTLLTVDLGGGTLDLMIMRLHVSGEKVDFEVLATGGAEHFGGEDFDALLEKHVIAREDITFNHEDLSKARIDHARLRQAIIEAKEYLSIAAEAELRVLLTNGEWIETRLKRSTFEELLYGNNPERRDFEQELQALLDRCLARARIADTAITTILPIGGSTQIPFFQNLLTTRFSRAKLVNVDNPNQLLFSVVQGAALYAAYLLDRRGQHPPHININREIQLQMRTSHDLGIKKSNGKIDTLVSADTLIPHRGLIRRVKQYIPVPSRRFADQFHIPHLEVFQGEGGAFTRIGCLHVAPTAYTHGRLLKDIKIEVEFQVSATRVDVRVTIPQGNADGDDICLQESIHLEATD